jgi:hypothetical protein
LDFSEGISQGNQSTSSLSIAAASIFFASRYIINVAIFSPPKMASAVVSLAGGVAVGRSFVAAATELLVHNKLDTSSHHHAGMCSC